MTVSIFGLPLEIIESILFFSTPSAVAAFSQTCKLYFSLIYSRQDDHFWRNFFFSLGLYDDPRLKLRPKNSPISWDQFVQRWTAATNVFSGNRPISAVDTIKSLLDLVDYSSPLPTSSLNLIYLNDLFRGHKDITALLDDFIKDEIDITSDRMQLVHRLKLCIAWPTVQRDGRTRLNARCYIYNLQNYKKCNFYGPYLPDGSGRVNWVHVFRALVVLINNMLDVGDNDHITVPPWSIQAIQEHCATDYAVIAEDVKDWAGITGKWKVMFSFCDHRDLLAFNYSSLFSQHQLTPSVFEDTGFEEALRELDFDFSVVGVTSDLEKNDKWPTRPSLRFIGKMGTSLRINGRVYMGPDDQVHWSFVSGEGIPMWSIEAVQIGGPGSTYGAIGTWTTIAHDEDDPVGPTWIRKQA